MKKWLLISYLFGLVVVPILFAVLPIDFFDHGQSFCLSVLFFDMSCYGCGMLRSLKHLLFFDFETAWELNKLAFVVFPLLSFVWIMEIVRVKRKVDYSRNKSSK